MARIKVIDVYDIDKFLTIFGSKLYLSKNAIEEYDISIKRDGHRYFSLNETLRGQRNSYTPMDNINIEEVNKYFNIVMTIK